MKNALGILTALLLSTSTACGDAPPRSGVTPLDVPAPTARAQPLPAPFASAARGAALFPTIAPSPEAITWTSAGDLAIIDGKTGTVRQVASTASLGGQTDLVYNPWTSEAVIFELDDDTQSGEISSHPVLSGPGTAHLGSRAHRGWIDGDARLLAGPLGHVIFEASYGERWKVFFAADGTTTSVNAPDPASAWLTAGAGGDFTVEALAYGLDGPLVRHTVSVAGLTVSPPVTAPLPLAPAGDPPTARMIPAPALGGDVLFDVVGSDLAVRLTSGATVSAAATAPLGQAGLRIEQAIGLDGGSMALLLLSGDSRVMALALGPTGGILSTATLPLSGVVREERRFFSHDLAALGPHRALAATSAGVFAIHMTQSGAGLTLALEPGFAGAALRGPIAAIAAHSSW